MAPATWCTFDPPYINCRVDDYGAETIDHKEMVDILLHARFPWVLSEYENKGGHGLYKVLGEPIRSPVANRMGTWTGHAAHAVECLWSNFEVAPVLQSGISEGIKRMPKVDTATLLQSLEKERDDIDAAIRALTRTLARNFAPATLRTKRQPTNPSKRKGHRWSEAQRKAMSDKLKASWAARGKSKK